MDDYGHLTDAADTEWQHCKQEQEYEQWLRDEAAQTEYQSWLVSLDTKRNPI